MPCRMVYSVPPRRTVRQLGDDMERPNLTLVPDLEGDLKDGYSVVYDWQGEGPLEEPLGELGVLDAEFDAETESAWGLS